MGFFSKKKAAEESEPTTVAAPEQTSQQGQNKEEFGSDAQEKAPSTDDKALPDDTNYQDGVRRMEAATQVWSKRDLVLAYGG